MRKKLNNGATANVDENASKETIEALNEAVKKVQELEEYPCYNCQGGGCPCCGGYGVIHIKK